MLVETGVPATFTMRTLAALLLLLTTAACRPAAKHYALRGQVLAKNEQAVTVSHDEIPGFMSAMTMPYRVKDPAAFEQLAPGDRVTADLVLNPDNTYWLERVSITDRSGRDTLPSITADELEPGTAIPDVTFINQDAASLHVNQFKGKAVLLTFIYTRCPFADFCPLVSNEFAAIERELRKTPGDYQRTHLVSISLDPAFDKPPVLRKYGLGYLRDDPTGFAHWDFVATAPGELKTLAAAFGLTYYSENNLITHSLRTILLAPDGTVAKVWSGNQWRKQELLDALRQAAATAPEVK